MIKVFLVVWILSWLSGCTGLHQVPSPVAIYDFDMKLVPNHPENPQSSIQPLKKSILVTGVATPSWLDNHTIHYRLLYHHPTQTYTYAQSRWIATPVSLLTRQIRKRIVTDSNEYVLKDNSIAKSDYILHIELEDLTQIFTSVADSHVVISLRASLIDRNSRNLLDQKDFRIEEKAPTADAAGAAAAASVASDHVTNEIIDWLTPKLVGN